MTRIDRLKTAYSLLAWLSALAVLAVAGWGAWRAVEAAPDHIKPWTPLALDHPINPASARKVHALRTDAPACRALLDAAGVGFRDVGAREGEGGCGWDSAVAVTEAAAPYSAPQPVTMRCPVAAGLTMWERQVLIPAADDHFGTGVAEIIHYGTYACRPVYGRPGARLSEHGKANAIDIAGFRLEDGRTVTVQDGWDGESDEQAFLREVRDGACGVFRAVLGPDYNAAHADHFHFDMGRWSVCR